MALLVNGWRAGYGPFEDTLMKRHHRKPVRDHTSPTPMRREDHGGRLWIYGHHAVVAALSNPERKILRLLATEDAISKIESDPNIEREALKRVSRASRRDIDAVLGEGAIHQGIALQTEAITRQIEDVLEDVADMDSAVVIVLDQITDPHNVGAIARSAAALGARAMISSTRHAPGEGGVLHKSASGALEQISFVQVVNIARTLDQLKAARFWIVGLAGDAEQTLSSIDLKGRIALVLGTEDQGLRRLVRENCDFLARLPMPPGIESLNVSNAAAVALYERARQTGAA